MSKKNGAILVLTLSLVLIIFTGYLNFSADLKSVKSGSESVTETIKMEQLLTKETMEEIRSNDFVASLPKKPNFSFVENYDKSLDKRYITYFNKNKTLSGREVVLKVNMNLDYPFYGLIEKTKNPFDLNVLCNKSHQLPSDFTPKNLVSVPKVYTINDGTQYLLDAGALASYINMSEAAKKDGIYLKIVSAYRSKEKQTALYNKYSGKYGVTEADRFSARPRHSEHETGLALDIYQTQQPFENTKEFAWLEKNAYLYGFIIRYPKGKEYLTGYMYEPWHYRYLGVEMTIDLQSSGLTYDEYYAINFSN